MNKNLFPFSAIVGQDSAKQALIYAAINPRIGGVLLSGQKGCAKSTLVRSFGEIIDDVDIINMPLNITEDMLFGTIDIESAIKCGKKKLSCGVLKRAHNNILYIDEVNLLPKSTADSILDVCQNGYAIVEREGISEKYPSRFLIVGTMNPEESLLSAQLTDRFGIYVEMKGADDNSLRVEIIKRRIEFEKAPEAFCGKFSEDDKLIVDKTTKAKKLLSCVVIDKDMIELSCELSQAAGAAGHRAELFIAETALAIAAYDNRKSVLEEDIQKAATFVLPHRIRVSQQINDELPQQEESSNDEEDNTLNEQQSEGDSNFRETQNNEAEYSQISDDTNNDAPENMQEAVDLGQEIYSLNDVFPQKKHKDSMRGSGRRSKSISGTSRGRYVGFNFPKGSINDIALDATLRAAAPYQTKREDDGVALKIRTSDIRTKRREHRVGNTIFFAVDASGSMGAKKRMVETKNAVLSLLYDAYQKRDKVSLIAFRKDEAEIILPVTRSINLAQKRLQSLPTGGRTPLAKGLMLAFQTIYSERIKDRDMIPLLVLITDGKVNDKNSDNPYRDVINVVTEIAKKDIPSIVIDTENSFFPLGISKDIAEHMKAEYVKVQELKACMISEIVRRGIG